MRKQLGLIVGILAFTACSFTACSDGGGGGSSSGSGDRSRAGGATTSEDRTSLAFENPAPNLSSAELDRHLFGDVNFGSIFVSPPATFNAGLGPTFNNSSCDGCHTKNGRGRPLFGTGSLGSQAVLRVSLPAGAGEPEVPGGSVPVPGLGTQFQDHAIFGTAPEGSVNLTYDLVSGEYGDGTPYQLRKPKISVTLADGSKLPGSVLTSMRTPPPIFGLGLLEAVPDDAILSLADPEDADGDGISGRPNFVWDVVLEKQVLGRFGRKANRPDLLQQAASAYINDMGVTNPIFPQGDEVPEVDGDILTSVEFYTQTLAVPQAARLSDPTVQTGESLFKQIGCAKCHAQQLRTGNHPVDAVANQRIFPYTDMLLHDMGEGLADGRPDFEADGNEWKTPPLWGIGVTATILSSTATFLHDGRARTLEEAILWHGGEAESAREQFRTLSATDRNAVLTFLRSL